MKLIPKQVDTNREWRERYSHRKRIVVTDDETCGKALRKLDKALERGVKGFGFDTETDTVERTKVTPVTAQVSYEDTDIFFSPEFVGELRPWIKKKPTMLGFEAKFEMWAMENAGMPWEGEVHDAQITDYLNDENIKHYDLKTRVSAIFKEPRRPGWKELFKNRKSTEVWASKDRDLFIDYALADSYDHLRLNEERAEALRKWPYRKDRGNMYDDFYLKSETALTKVLYKMERTGALMDVDLLNELHEKAQSELEITQRKFYAEINFDKLPQKTKKAIKGEFNGFSEKLMNSPQQLMELFYNVLEYPHQYHMVKDKKTGKKIKKLTTDDSALEALAAEGYPAAVLLQRDRTISKLDGTYLVGLVERADDRDYVHTNFMQAFTTTGRLSSRDPNLQNIPRKANDEFGIRHSFIAPPGYVIVGGDYGQIETRLMAIMSGDKDMIRACMESDIYVAMAQVMYHKPKEFFAKNAKGERTPEADKIRQHVKAIVLGIGFGKQAKSIGRELGISEQAANNLLKMYFMRFPVFAKWMRRQIQKAKDEGFVRTIAGRYRRLPDLRLPNTKENWWRRSTAERQALNSPVQGSAWEIMKKSMLNLDTSDLYEKYDSMMFLTVHDELLNYVPKKAAKEFAPKFKEIMEHPFATDFAVPLAVETYSAYDWGAGK